ncbi:MAG: hypothetical protein C4532_15590 [Candidatus Abyssobacteria bacterium SURF_17]|uniref:Peptidase M14 domain-containing protein n=1 Tax=Candidatus Abyssobacteria bacterium SURF_17 TaxID=2093361 RepID=A0A419ESW5_9BACT|nr:MAG: hypothetical protein C4532_15590 [Candidatus Abyssubacteria bacterium SURF_17]
MIELFEKYPLIKDLNTFKRYSDLEAGMLALRDRLHVEEVARSKMNRPIYAVNAGAAESAHKILLTAANHGREDAPPLALLSIARQLAQPNRDLERLMKSVSFILLPCLDPDGYDLRGVKCVDPIGNTEIREEYSESSWEDVNAVWCRADEFLPPETRALKKYLLELHVSLALDLHETLFYRPSLRFQLPPQWRFYPNSFEVTVIEFIPESQRDLGESVGASIVENLKRSYYVPRKVSNLGRFLRKIFVPLPQTITKGEGREISGPLLTEFRKGRMVLSDWLTLSTGIPSFTFESFLSPLDYRVGAHIAGVEGAVLAFAGLMPQAVSARQVKRIPFPKKKKFHIESAKEAMQLLGEECRMVVHRKDGRLTRERLIAWNSARRLEFRKRWLRSISVWELYS